jgi:hypothetical protein
MKYWLAMTPDVISRRRNPKDVAAANSMHESMAYDTKNATIASAYISWL